MDLLTAEESMEVERNESLLLLVGLCNNEAQIQKLVVFEGAFDVVFNIIAKEQQSGVIVQVTPPSLPLSLSMSDVRRPARTRKKRPNDGKMQAETDGVLGFCDCPSAPASCV